MDLEDLADAGATSPCHVVAMPYPGRGHINPMMNLCRLLAARGLHVTFVVTEEWLGLLNSASSPPPPPGVRLRSIPNVIPSEVGRAKDFMGFFEAVYTKMEVPFDHLLDDLDPPATAVVADTYVPWAVAAGGRRGVPVYSLFTMAATFFSVLHHIDRLPGTTEATDDPLKKYIPSLTSIRMSDIPHLLSMGKPKELALEAISRARKAQGILFTSFFELEPVMIATLRAELPCPVYPVGPSIPYMMLQEKSCNPLHSNGNNTTDYLQWLDSQQESSVLYVSLGSFLSVSGPQMEEIAMGLRVSGSPFLWVARENASRMQEMGGGLGLVVPWCDQLRVLCHPSVGGFLTHCGWNSTLEGVYAGVPMLTLPIFRDQPGNSRLVVEEWKVGLSVREEAKWKDLIPREDIGKIVKRLMDLDGSESKEMRRRAMELRETSRGAIQEGGSSHANLNCFFRDLKRVMVVKVANI